MSTTADTALTVEQLDRSGTASHDVYTAGFYDSDWDFSIRLLLGKATRGATDIAKCSRPPPSTSSWPTTTSTQTGSPSTG